MSKVGKKPIKIPENVQVSVSDSAVTVKGPKGELKQMLHPKVRLAVEKGEIRVSVLKPEDRRQRALWGTFWALLRNMVAGVTAGFEKRLEIVGVGYRAQVAGNKLVLSIGYSHPVELLIPPGLEAKMEKNVITVTGQDKQAVGEFAAYIRSRRKPEPYKGKGIKYAGEVIRRKAGKVVKAVGAG